MVNVRWTEDGIAEFSASGTGQLFWSYYGTLEEDGDCSDFVKYQTPGSFTVEGRISR